MDEMWGDSVVKLQADNTEKGELFIDGNYAMFIHWGLYSSLANLVDGKTYYGIGEWIMHPNMAGIPVEAYKQLAASFNPAQFDAEAIVQIAKDAGMKYVVITAKHHEGFAMYDSAASDFNIVDATPYGKDPLIALSVACRAAGLGLGVYYSHFQDWTAPGGGRGLKVDADGNPASFKDYFVNKCLPQVEELTSNYGPLVLFWFDTPGSISKEDAEQLIAVVRKNQPNTLINGRVGHGLGDYKGLGDMEVPLRNVPGIWESVDTTNDSWAYAWYDENWKSPKEILRRLISTVARGGTYMLNIGPRADGTVPERASQALRRSGEWINEYPQVVYGADASPWQHALPWGDVTVQGNRLLLSVFEWPDAGKLYLPGLLGEVQAAHLLNSEGAVPITFTRSGNTVLFNLPADAPDPLVSVINVDLRSAPKADPTFALDPTMMTTIEAEFCTVEGATLKQKRWMEKFGEWKHLNQVSAWKEGASATWQVEVLEEGDYQVGLSYSGQGRLVWEIAVTDGETIRNQQAASQIYQHHPMGWLNFPVPRRYTINVRLLEGDGDTSSLSAIHFSPVMFK